MSLYVNNAANEPDMIFYNGSSLDTVYFNGELVWKKEKVFDYTNWEDIVEIAGMKARGEITEWPQEIWDMADNQTPITVPLTGTDTTNKWGYDLNTATRTNTVDLYITTAANLDLFDFLPLYAVCHIEEGYYYPYDNLRGYLGYTNSNPRNICNRLANLLPFKDKLIPKVSQNAKIDWSNPPEFQDGGYDGYDYFPYQEYEGDLSTDTDYVFLLNTYEANIGYWLEKVGYSPVGNAIGEVDFIGCPSKKAVSEQLYGYTESDNEYWLRTSNPGNGSEDIYDLTLGGYGPTQPGIGFLDTTLKNMSNGITISASGSIWGNSKIVIGFMKLGA